MSGGKIALHCLELCVDFLLVVVTKDTEKHYTDRRGKSERNPSVMLNNVTILK